MNKYHAKKADPKEGTKADKREDVKLKDKKEKGSKR